MYLRFVQHARDPDTGLRTGLFVAAYRLANNNTHDLSIQARCHVLLDWFEANLTTPDRFNRTTSKGEWRRVTHGLSWFKPTAQEHVGKAHELRGLLAEADIMTEVLRTSRPGYIIYEDAFQIVSEPFADTPV